MPNRAQRNRTGIQPTITAAAPPPPPRRRLVSIPKAAEHVDVCTRTIRRYIAAGLIPAYRLGPKLVKVDLNDLDRLAQRIPTAG